VVSGGWRFKGWVKTVGGLAYVMTTSSHPLSLLHNDNQGWRPRLYLVFIQGLFLILYLGLKWFRVPFPIFPTIFRAISYKWISYK